MRQNKNDSEHRGTFRLGRKPAIILSAMAVLALAIPAVAGAKKGKGGQKVKVMTRNLHLGADLLPLTEASSLGEAIDLAGVVYNEFQSTKFQERVVPLAKEIKQAKPDLVGLQEVALWKTQEPSDGGSPPLSPIGTPATDVAQDFLAMLQAELKKKGPKYRVVEVQEEFNGELPADVDQNDATGSGPAGAGVFGADVDASLLMRDVILVKRGTKVKLGKTDSGNFDTKFQPNIGGIDLPVDRGWLSVEAKVKGKKKGRKAKKSKFRFINTHLEAYGDPTIREAQAKELIAGPAKTKKQVILVGDINSGLQERHATGGYQFQPGDPLAFQAFAAAGFKDNGAVHTASHDDLFDPADGFDHTVDHVLTNPGLNTKKAFVTGDDPAEMTPSGLWPSDHGGVVSKLQLKK